MNTIKQVRKQVRKFNINSENLKPGTVVDLLDLHNGKLSDRLRLLAKAIDRQEKGKSVIKVIQSSLDIFIHDLFKFLGIEIKKDL